MSDVVLLQIITYAFWLILALIIISVFRREIKTLVSSLTSFNVAGAHFELLDKKATLESYALLSDIFVGLLSNIEVIEKLHPLISEQDARRLAKFTVQYAEEVPKEKQDTELWKGVGHLLTRKGLFREAIHIYDVLLRKTPDDLEVLNLKALALFNTGSAENTEQAEKMYNRLVVKYPRSEMLWFNRALTRSLLGKYDESFSDLNQVLALGAVSPDYLEDPFLRPLQTARPKQFKELGQQIRRILEQST